jgi:hypothetical protein
LIFAEVLEALPQSARASAMKLLGLITSAVAATQLGRDVGDTLTSVHLETIVVQLFVRILRWGLGLLALSTQEPSSFSYERRRFLGKRGFIPIREGDLLQPEYEVFSNSSQSESEVTKR